MDPEATWRDLSEAYAESDWDRIEELAGALFQWVHNGGFPPRILGKSEFDRMVVSSVCSFLKA